MYRTILVATDGSELATRGVEHAIAVAAALDATLVIVTVSEPWNAAFVDPSGLVGVGDYLADYRASAQTRADEVLGAVSALASRAGVDARLRYVPERPPADAILETADAEQADLLVLASHGRRGLQRLLLGSQAQSVVTRSERPVLVVR